MTSYETTVNNIKFEIWDSPGLQDITEEDEAITLRIAQTLKERCHHLHLLLYCIRMDRDRVELSELKAIKELSQVFTAKVWDTAVFALTFANRVLLPPDKESDEEAAEWFKERIKEFQKVIVKALVESGVPEHKANKVPAIPTGYHTPTKMMPNPRELFDRPDWFNPFWHSCANHMEENALVPLLASQKHRVKLVSGKTTSEHAKEIAQKQQELNRKEKELEERLKKQKLEIDSERQQLEESRKAEEKRQIEEKRRMADEREKHKKELERMRIAMEEEDKLHKPMMEEQKHRLKEQQALLQKMQQEQLDRMKQEQLQREREEIQQTRKTEVELQRERELIWEERRMLDEQRRFIEESQNMQGPVCL